MGSGPPSSARVTASTTEPAPWPALRADGRLDRGQQGPPFGKRGVEAGEPSADSRRVSEYTEWVVLPYRLRGAAHDRIVPRLAKRMTLRLGDRRPAVTHITLQSEWIQ